VNVFPYSIFYVFYEQYLTVWEDAGIALGVCLLAVFGVVLILTGVNLFAAGVTFLVVLLTAINITGSMVYLGISLNAISIVNLVMTIGISVEFCSHLVAAFVDSGSSQEGDRNKEDKETPSSSMSREERALFTLNDWGAVLLAGVHLTNLLGVSVLVLAKSKIFNVYYFR